MATNNNQHAKKVVYKECRRNYGTRSENNIFDGCGQFMANGPTGTPGAMVCVLCQCHKYFHRREVELLPQNNSDLPHQNEGVNTLSPLPHSQPQQTHDSSQSTGHQHTPSPAASTDHQEGLHLSTNPAPGIAHHLPQGHMTEGGSRMNRTRITEKQSQALRLVAERNNWKMFRQYSKEDIDQTCSRIGIRRSVMKSWINRHRPRNNQVGAAATGMAADPTTAAGADATEGALNDEFVQQNNE